MFFVRRGRGRGGGGSFGVPSQFWRFALENGLVDRALSCVEPLIGDALLWGNAGHADAIIHSLDSEQGFNGRGPPCFYRHLRLAVHKGRVEAASMGNDLCGSVWRSHWHIKGRSSFKPLYTLQFGFGWVARDSCRLRRHSSRKAWKGLHGIEAGGGWPPAAGGSLADAGEAPAGGRAIGKWATWVVCP